MKEVIGMVRTLELRHDSFEAKVPPVKRVKKKDWDLSILENVDDFKIERFQEYKELDFPVWKRAMMEGIDLPDYSKSLEFYLDGFETLDCDPEIFEKYDFEGSDRKYVLLADIFNNFGLCARVSEDSRINLEFSNLSIERIYIEAHGISRILRNVKGKGTRITSERIVVKSNSKLEMIEVLDIDGVNISNVYFHLEEGAELVIRHLSKSGGKSVEYYLAVLKEDSSLTMDHRTVQEGGITDALFFEKIEGENSKARVSAKGAVKSGKVIFRGMMDLPKGVKGVDASENFKAILLSEDATFEAIPSIFASENELSAQHGASSSPLSKEEIFYLSSRGLSREDVVELIVKEMMEEVESLIRGI